ncbi:dihydrofolate reductase family protein [Mucilaginibacter sp.]|uniref:dihydrofolate reductase family protein n=1 Tax=Mucilaginibacter sp. TaxID=1882438 RepID=UPI0035BBE2E1
MRNTICAMNISIDGCYDHTRFNGDDELLDYFTDLMKDVDQTVTGRKMYELMVPHWPDIAKNQSGTKAANEYADTVSVIDTIVFSTTMEEFDGGPRILRGNLEAEVRKLKEQPGKKISIGGVSLRSQLIKLGLIDEFYFVIHPVLAGSGPRLLEGFDMDEIERLELVDTKILKSGCVALHYIKQ